MNKDKKIMQEKKKKDLINLQKQKTKILNIKKEVDRKI